MVIKHRMMRFGFVTKLTIPFDTEDACSKTVNKTEDDPAVRIYRY
jgi:hypothetical protein